MRYQSNRSKYVVSDAPASSGKGGATGVGSSEPSKRVATAKGVRRLIGNITHKLRLVARDEGSQSGGTAATQSPTNSTDDVPRWIVVPDGDFMSRSTKSPRGKRSIAHDYQILPQVAGRGIDGEVRRCVHLRSSEPCAVKTVRRGRRQRRRSRILREVALMNEVNHPNVVELRDAYEDEENVHMVMELCRGGELFDRIVERARRGGRGKRVDGSDERAAPSCFRERDAARIIRSVLSAASYLHSKDIVHRDIKPENILFAEEDVDVSPVKLIDFGLAARHARDDKPLTATVGTGYYMAPEVLDGSYDRACDLWSIGVVAYILLSGRPPFNGRSDDEIRSKIRRGLDRGRMDSSELWEGIGEEAKDFVGRLLVMDPNERWTADMALDHPWLKVRRSG